MPSVLIIAYGNPLRSDDGLAWHAAKALEGKFGSSEVEILCLHQLAPELAQTASSFDCVIFVDATLPGAVNASQPGEVRVSDLHERPPRSDQAVYSFHASVSTHGSRNGGTVLSVRLKAFAITMTGENFEHGESLSPTISAALPGLVLKIESTMRAALSQE